jgi:hypothetical protein
MVEELKKNRSRGSRFWITFQKFGRRASVLTSEELIFELLNAVVGAGAYAV